MHLRWRIVYIHCKATSIFPRGVGPPQYVSMLNLHALTLDLHIHAHIQTYIPTKHRHRASRFNQLSFKASVRCPSAPNITIITNKIV